MWLHAKAICPFLTYLSMHGYASNVPFVNDIISLKLVSPSGVCTACELLSWTNTAAGSGTPAGILQLEVATTALNALGLSCTVVKREVLVWDPTKSSLWLLCRLSPQ